MPIYVGNPFSGRYSSSSLSSRKNTYIYPRQSDKRIDSTSEIVRMISLSIVLLVSFFCHSSLHRCTQRYIHRHIHISFEERRREKNPKKLLLLLSQLLILIIYDRYRLRSLPIRRDNHRSIVIRSTNNRFIGSVDCMLDRQ